MKILGYNITRDKDKSLKKVNNLSPKQAKKILDEIKESQLFRTREEIDTWRAAVNRAESVLNPDRTYLIRCYRDAVLDGHLSSLMSTVQFQVASSPFFLETKDGEPDDEILKNFKKTWFYDFIKHVVDAEFYGYSLIQLGDAVDGCFKEVDLVPREYIIPEKKGVKKSLHVTSNLVSFVEPPYSSWLIWVEDKDSLGLLSKAAPYAIWKKGVIGAWSEAAEVFGMPIRVGKTDINNPTNYQNMVKFLGEMGSNAFGVFDNDDNIEFIETAKSDYFQVYDKLIERVNSEMSKLMVGQTMTSDDGSSRSQAEVHKEILDALIMAVKRRLSGVVNEKLLPLMSLHGLVKNGLYFRYDDEEKVSLEVKFKWAIEAVKTGKYKVSADWLESTFGVPFEEIEETDPEAAKMIARQKTDEENDDDESVMPEVENLYKDVTHHHH